LPIIFSIPQIFSGKPLGLWSFTPIIRKPPLAFAKPDTSFKNSFLSLSECPSVVSS